MVETRGTGGLGEFVFHDILVWKYCALRSSRFLSVAMLARFVFTLVTIYPYLFHVFPRLNFADTRRKTRFATLKLSRYARLETFNYTRKRHLRPSFSSFLTRETLIKLCLKWLCFFLSLRRSSFFVACLEMSHISSIYPCRGFSTLLFLVPLSSSRTRIPKGEATIITAFSRVHVEYKVS